MLILKALLLGRVYFVQNHNKGTSPVKRLRLVYREPDTIDHANIHERLYVALSALTLVAAAVCSPTQQTRTINNTTVCAMSRRTANMTCKNLKCKIYLRLLAQTNLTE